MDPVSVIVAALAAGAVAGAENGADNTATQAVRDAYGDLKSIIQQLLTEAGAGADPEAVAAAQQLLRLLDEAGSHAGEYVVHVEGAHGVQVGEHNTQTNTFTTPPRRPS
jgi:hypothetical protein